MKHSIIKIVPVILGVLCIFNGCSITDLSPKASFECLRVVGLTATHRCYISKFYGGLIIPDLE